MQTGLLARCMIDRHACRTTPSRAIAQPEWRSEMPANRGLQKLDRRRGPQRNLIHCYCCCLGVCVWGGGGVGALKTFPIIWCGAMRYAY